MISKSASSYFQHLIQVRSIFLGLIGLALLGFAIVPINSTNASYPGGDWDSNAIIRGGVGSCGELASKINESDAEARQTFQITGVSANQACSAVSGTVTRDNKVIVDGKVVAQNVYTFGREDIPGSQALSGGAWQRHPSVSFRSASIPAYVYMVNGQFKWAVIKTCGNPVIGTPTYIPKIPNPRYDITKKVNLDLNANTDTAFFLGSKSVQAKQGQKVRFISQSSNLGNVKLNGAITDTLPSGTTFVSGSWQVKRGGKIVGKGEVGRVGNGYAAWYSLDPGDEIKINIVATYNTNVRVRNVACTKAQEIAQTLCDDAFVTPTPTPVVKIPGFKISKKVTTDLKASTDSAYFYGKEGVQASKGQQVRFLTMAENTGDLDLNASVLDKLPAGTTYVSGKFQLKKNLKTIATGNLTKYGSEYGWKGNLPVGGEVKLDILVVYNTEETVKNIACITAPEIPGKEDCDDAYIIPKKDAECVSLKAEKIGTNQYKFKVAGRTSGGATINSFKMDYGDGQTQTLNKSGSGSVTTESTHKYADANASPTVIATAVTSLGDKTSPGCQTIVKITLPEAACVSLSANTVDRATREFTVQATAQNGAVINQYVFDFGDEQVISSKVPKTKITFKDPGQYTVTAKLKTNIGDKTSEACKVTVNISEEDQPALDVEKRVTTNVNASIDEAGFAAAQELVEIKPKAEVRFLIKATNTGNIALKNVKLRDVLPEGLTLASGEQNPTIDNLEPGASVYFAVNAIASDSIGAATVTNVVCIAHDTNEDGKTDLNCNADKCPKNPDIAKGEDLVDCDDARVKIVPDITVTPGPETPGSIPKTGPITSAIAGIVFIGLSVRTWITSRRKLLSAQLKPVANQTNHQVNK
jgi:uncharacterized repeat protein (TIGR01451 family)